MKREVTTTAGTALRLAVVMNSMHGGGAEFVGRTWATGLRDAGHAVTLVLLESPRAGQNVIDLTGIRVVDLGDLRTSKKILALRSIISKSEQDAVISLQMFANLLCLVARRLRINRSRAALLVSERNIVSINSARPNWSHRTKVAAARRLYRTADILVAISHPVAAEMVAGFSVPGNRVRVVPNPAAVKRPSTSTDARPESEFDIDLVVANRLSAQKRPSLSVDVAQILNERGHATRVVVFGDGELRDDMESAARRAGLTCEFRGWVENWPAACAPNSVLLLPSVKEGFGNVLVEAAAHRIPSVAASEALGVADAIVPNVTGVLAADSEPTTLADAVLQAQNCRFGGLDAWMEHFSIENSVAVLTSAVLAAARGR